VVLLVSEQQQEAQQLADLATVDPRQRSVVNAHGEPAEEEELAALSSRPRTRLQRHVGHRVDAILDQSPPRPRNGYGTTANTLDPRQDLMT
jgi:hypothetical protein